MHFTHPRASRSMRVRGQTTTPGGACVKCIPTSEYILTAQILNAFSSTSSEISDLGVYTWLCELAEGIVSVPFLERRGAAHPGPTMIESHPGGSEYEDSNLGRDTP